MKQYYRIVVIVIAAVLGIMLSAILFFDEETQIAINEPVTEEYYQLLKENSMQVAKTLDLSTIEDKTVTADFRLNEKDLVVTVESMKAKLTATFPISNYSLNVEDGIIKSQATVEFDNVQYEEVNKLPSALWCIAMSIAMGVALTAFVYFIFYGLWRPGEEE